ncbi:MAG: ferritin-like domain-containing protein [bacterium]
MAEPDPLDYAIQLEQDGQAYYSEAATNTTNPLGKKMFESLAADESRHEDIVRRIARKTDVAVEGELPKKRLVTLFDTLGQELRRDLSADADDTQVIEKALEMEKASIDHYQKQAQQTSDESHRAVYQRLTQEERQHHEILQDTLTYLNDTGLWFLWDEQALLDGG